MMMVIPMRAMTTILIWRIVMNQRCGIVSMFVVRDWKNGSMIWKQHLMNRFLLSVNCMKHARGLTSFNMQNACTFRNHWVQQTVLTCIRVVLRSLLLVLPVGKNHVEHMLAEENKPLCREIMMPPIIPTHLLHPLHRHSARMNL